MKTKQTIKCYTCLKRRPIPLNGSVFSKQCDTCRKRCESERRCSQCGIWKAINNFAKCSGNRGYQGYCKDCQSANSPKYEARRDPEKQKLRHKEQWQKRKHNPLYQKRTKLWREKNKDYLAEHNKKWRKENKLVLKVYGNNTRARRLSIKGRILSQDWLFILQYCNYTCLACDEKNEDLMMDHVISLHDGGLNLIENIQPLCPRCNLKKGLKSGLDFRTEEFNSAISENCTLNKLD